MIRGNSLSGNSGDIAAYTGKDDYFSEGGQVVGQWQGQGAEGAGLVGDVKPEDFRQVLDGITPNGQQLGTVREGELEHRPGWDFTVSAPKSVSEVALVAGDRHAIEAHEAGVRAAIAVLERGAEYRERVGGDVVHRRGDGIVAVTFNHSTSRAGDPQLHTHVIVANMVRAADGTWRSLETREMFALQRAADIAYKAEVARYLTRAGYELDIDRKTGDFELRGVPESLRDLHSQRTDQIDRALQAQGLDRETASAAERDKASLETRADKVHEDPAAARARWQADAKAHGWDHEAHKREAAARAAGYEHRPEDAARAADHAVAFATHHLGEREARFSRSDLEAVAMNRAMGDASPAEIHAAVDRAVADGTLVVREIDHGSNHPTTSAFTTPQAIRDESRMLASEARGRGLVEGMVTRAEAHAIVARAEVAAAATGHNWNEGQRAAAIGALTNRNTVTGIQGYAGTAKTSTVLATLAQAARERDIEVKAMAPTGTAAQKLGSEIGAESSTVTKFLNDAAKPGNEDMGRGGVWIVDEASLLSTGQARALVELAEGRGAHLIVTGDVKQHEAVEAGGPFAQLQASGMEAYVLGDILRQTNDELRNAVYSSVEGRAAEAFAKLETGGGKVIEIADADARHRQMAVDYTAMNASGRDNTIMVSSSRDGRDAITADVREILVQKGELSGPAVNVQGLDRIDMTKAQARYADNYQPGQVVKFTFNLKSAGLEAGKAYEVAGTNKESNRVTLKAEDGSLREWNPRQGGAKHVNVSERVNVELRQGDKVALTGRLETGTNGMAGRVEAVNGREATVRLKNGDAVKMREGETLPVRHGYVHTTYAAQGQTTEKVMANMPATGKGAKASTDRAFYVSLSRGQAEAKIYTNDQAKLADRVSVHTAKTNALDRGTETKAAQQGRFEEHQAAVRGPSIAESKQRIAAGLEKPPAAMQRDGSNHGISPSHVAERMGANKAPNETAISKTEAAKVEVEKSWAEPMKAPSIEEVRERIERPLEREAVSRDGHEQVGKAGGSEREAGFTKAEIETASDAQHHAMEQSHGEAVYAAEALDSLREEVKNSDRSAALGSKEREEGSVAGNDRQPETAVVEQRQEPERDVSSAQERERTQQSLVGHQSVADHTPSAVRDVGEQARQEPVADQHREDAVVDRVVERATFERDAGPESSHAAAWSELDRERGLVTDREVRGTENTPSERQPMPERIVDAGRQTGEQSRHVQGADTSASARGNAAQARSDRQQVSDRGVQADRGAANADGRLTPQAGRIGGAERGIAPSQVADRMLAKMVERAAEKSKGDGNQITREVDRGSSTTVRDHDGAKNGEREHKHEGGMER